MSGSDGSWCMSGEETSATTRARVAARAIQRRLFSTRAACNRNVQMGLREIVEYCRNDESTRAFLQKAIESL